MSEQSHPDSANIRVYPPVGFLLCLAVGIAIELWLPLRLPELPQPAGFFTGLGVALLALLFIVAGAGRFVRLGVNPIPNKPAAHLVTGGIFRLTRNPMYVGAVLMLIAIGIGAGSIPIVLCAVPLFLLLHYHVIAREEIYLRRKFGQEFEDFSKRVHRWL